MTQEEKELLLKDLCARLPYGVKYKDAHGYKKTIDIWSPEFHTALNTILYDGKPSLYLRPMSSMIEKEREHLQKLHDIKSDENYGDGFSPAAWEAILDFNNYCHEHHLDNGGLITLGLALEAPEGMYNTKQ